MSSLEICRENVIGMCNRGIHINVPMTFGDQVFGNRPRSMITVAQNTVYRHLVKGVRDLINDNGGDVRLNKGLIKIVHGTISQKDHSAKILGTHFSGKFLLPVSGTVVGAYNNSIAGMREKLRQIRNQRSPEIVSDIANHKSDQIRFSGA